MVTVAGLAAAAVTVLVSVWVLARVRGTPEQRRARRQARCAHDWEYDGYQDGTFRYTCGRCDLSEAHDSARYPDAPPSMRNPAPRRAAQHRPDPWGPDPTLATFVFNAEQRHLDKELRTGPKPTPRMVRDAREAELLAAEWVRWLGWPTAKATPPTADSGIDVAGRGVVAQVKFEATKAGRPYLHALYGAGHAAGADTWLFFASAGYSTQAITWADEVGMCLFRFTLDGAIEAVNEPARSLYVRGRGRGARARRPNE